MFIVEVACMPRSGREEVAVELVNSMRRHPDQAKRVRCMCESRVEVEMEAGVPCKHCMVEVEVPCKHCVTEVEAGCTLRVSGLCCRPQLALRSCKCPSMQSTQLACCHASRRCC